MQKEKPHVCQEMHLHDKSQCKNPFFIFPLVSGIKCFTHMPICGEIEVAVARILT